MALSSNASQIETSVLSYETGKKWRCRKVTTEGPIV